MVKLVIRADGQRVQTVEVLAAELATWTTVDVRNRLRETVRGFDVIGRFWRFSADDEEDASGQISALGVTLGEDTVYLEMYYDRRLEVLVGHPDIGAPEMRRQPGLKRGEKPYPLLWDPPLVERRETGTESGMGLFALEPIKKGTFITEYGGEILSHEDAAELHSCDKTHLLPMYQNGPVFDGRIHGEYTYDFYESQGLLAQFANDKRGTGRPGNVDYKSQGGDLPGGEHMTPEGQMVPVAARKFLVATKDIAPGEELLVLNYGPGHQKAEADCRKAREDVQR
jgi:hypothetical protein